MLTAAITAVVAAVLSFFGVEPGPYLVGVAIGVKVALVLGGMLVGARWVQKRQARQASPAKPSDPG
jgi:hypothetical protein